MILSLQRLEIRIIDVFLLLISIKSSLKCSSQARFYVSSIEFNAKAIEERSL
ncbi:hypothetical protein LEP1GSC018_1446 [Leptospira kirschneri str. 2008720114]|nr:hypothetical protein LEP1GSC018_1446 [Leptospira kirschneri str. 2008720114]